MICVFKSIILCSVFFWPLVGFPKEVRFTSTDYPPYYGVGLDNYGPISEVIIEAYRLSGYKVHIDFMPWARAEMFAVKGHDYDGMFPPWKSEKRKKVFLFSLPMPPNNIGFYKKKNKEIVFSSYKDIENYLVGTVKGFVNPEGFDEANFKKHYSSTAEQNIKMLCKGRVDLALSDQLVGQYLLESKLSDCLGDIEFMDTILSVNAQYLVISKNAKNAQEKMDAFNMGLLKLNSSKQLEKIFEKHGISYQPCIPKR